MKTKLFILIALFVAAFSLPAQAQLGGMLNKAKNKAKEAVTKEVKKTVEMKTEQAVEKSETVESETTTVNEQSEATKETENAAQQTVKTEAKQDAKEELDDRPAPTGDKLKDKYNGLFYRVRKCKEATDIDKKYEHFQTASTLRNFYVERGDFSENDERFAELTEALKPLYNELKPHNFERLEPVKSIAEINAGTYAKLDEKYGINFRYNGEDAATLKNLAEKEFKARMSGAGAYEIVYSGFKHGWIVNEERSGQQVVAHIKRLRYTIIYQLNGKYYIAEALFSQRAPVLGSYTKQEWPGVGFYKDPIDAGYVKNHLMKKKK